MVSAGAGLALVLAQPHSSCSGAGNQPGAANDFGMGACNVLADGFDGGTKEVMNMVGIPLLLVGAALIVAGAATSDHEPETRTSAPRAMPAAIPATDAAATAINSRIENRLAIQASILAHANQCAGARITADQLALRDPQLYRTLMANDVELVRCYRM